MKCYACQGPLDPTDFLACTYCGVRQEIDLRRVHFRPLGSTGGMACPRCPAPGPVLERIGLQLGGSETEIERCPQCQGLFFNPGELEAFLETEVAGTLWTDLPRMDQVKAEIREMPRPEDTSERYYIPCPHPGCGVSMNRQNFGRGSGVMLDSCRDHGVWLDGGELRALAGWWHAGGKYDYHVAEVNAARSRAALARHVRDIEASCSVTEDWSPPRAGANSDTVALVRGLASAVASFFSTD